MARRLYLHIGTGKAGSTTIQQAIHRMNGADAGVAPVRAFGTPNATRLVAASSGLRGRTFFVEKRKVMTQAEFNDNAFTLWLRTKAEIDASEVESFVSSSEFLINKVRGTQVQQLRDALDPLFDNIKIIVYLRDQTSFLRSLWSQSVRGPTKSHLTFSQYMETIDGRRQQWDYKSMLTHWIQVFGRKNIKACVFDPKAFFEGDLLKDFFSKIGATADPAFLSSDHKENVTPTGDEIDDIRYANLVDLAKKLGVDPPPQAPGDDMDSVVYENTVRGLTSAGNAWINAKLLEGHDVKLPV